VNEGIIRKRKKGIKKSMERKDLENTRIYASVIGIAPIRVAQEL